MAQYKITFSVRDYKDEGTSDPLYVRIVSMDRSETAEELCDADFNVTNQDVVCAFQSIDASDYECISLRNGGRNRLQFTKVISIANELKIGIC